MSNSPTLASAGLAHRQALHYNAAMFDNVVHIRTFLKGHRADDRRAIRFFNEGVLAGNGNDPNDWAERFPHAHAFAIWEHCYARWHNDSATPPDHTAAVLCHLGGMRQRTGLDFPIYCERLGGLLLDRALDEARETRPA